MREEMLMRIYLATLLGVCLFLGGATVVQAQPSITNPPVSPYYNLYRGGASPVFNYLTAVSPELALRSSVAQLQQQQNASQQAVGNVQTTGPLTTGHVAGFQTQRAYFQTLTGGGVGAAGTGASFGTINRPIPGSGSSGFTPATPIVPGISGAR
jgi:hypothetical protein